MQLQGKTILITGGASGLGLESAKQFLHAGMSVIICGRNQSKLDSAKSLFPEITTIHCDVSNPEHVKALYEQVTELGGIDILYNNAGVITLPHNLGLTNAHNFDDAEYEMSINYLAVIRLINGFLGMLKEREDAAIINTTSVLAYLPALLVPTYSASKAALHFYTVSLRKHLAVIGSSVKVFEILPPLVDTVMTEGLDVKKMSTGDVISALLTGLLKDEYTIRVGPTKFLYFMNRFFPGLAFSMLNHKKQYRLIRS